MLLLTSTSDIIRVVTTGTASLNVHVSYVDNASGTITPGRTNTAAITTATTTTICAAPSSGVQRNVKYIGITNNSSTTSTQCTVQHFDGLNSEDLMGVTLLPGENLIMTETGDWNHHDAQGGDYAYTFNGTDVYTSGYGITGTLAESVPRTIAGVNVAALTSGTLFLQAIYLRAGTTITNISFFSGTTAAGTPTNGFFALYDNNRNLLANCTNFTTEAWAASTVKTKPLTATYRTTYTGLYYVGIMITATTVPSLTGVTAAANAGFKGMVPILSGNSTAALTTSLPNPAAAITTNVNTVWCAVT